MPTYAEKKSAHERFKAGSTMEQIAEEYGVHPRTVYKWATAGGWSSAARTGAALDLEAMPKTIEEAVAVLQQATFVAVGILQQDALAGNIGNGHQHMRFARALEWLHHMRQNLGLDDQRDDREFATETERIMQMDGELRESLEAFNEADDHNREAARRTMLDEQFAKLLEGLGDG
ncbi:MAG: hypothetical protein AAGK33_11930 [Pseudomonadota bacterium]